MMRRLILRSIFVTILWPGICAAQDKFEIQVYDSETAAPGEIGLETHLNHIFEGSTVPSPEGAIPTHRTTRLTFEPHVGVLDWVEVGVYLQTALRQSGAFDYGGVKLRLKGKYPQKLWQRVGLALNLEISSIPRIYEPNRYGSEVRFIADAVVGYFYFAVNPILSIDLKGQQAGIPQLEPAAKIALSFHDPVTFGFEYYGGYGPLNQLFASPGQSNVLYGVADYVGPNVDVNVGLGYGFSGDERWWVKAIFTFHTRH